MKRGNFLGLLVIFLIGCSSVVEETPETPPAPELQEPTMEQPSAEDVDVVVVESIKPTELPDVPQPLPPPPKSLDPEVVELLKKALRVRSYQYNYRGPPDRIESADVWVNDNFMKIVYTLHRNVEKSALRWNTLYFDTAAKKVSAYCQERTKCFPLGIRPDVQVDYEAEYRLTPMDWYNRMVEADRIGEQTFDRAKVIGLDFSYEGREVRVWVSELYGLPQLVEDGDDKYEYTALSINAVTDADVKP